jgi:hypothetical protein
MNDIIYPKIPINFYAEKETNEENPACVNSALLIKENKVHVIKISKLYSRSSEQPLEFEYVQYDVSDFFETVQQSESMQKSLNNNDRSVLKKVFPTATRFITEDGSIII